MSEKVIEFKNVNKWYGKFHVLKDINLHVNKSEKIIICGPSGSGKSTLIRCINGLEQHQDGNIIVQGNELDKTLKNVEKIRGEVGMVFQQFNLFPHLTILDNCALAPAWVKKIPKKRADEIAMEYLTKVKISEQAKKYPGQLSGGQQQRAAIARASHEMGFAKTVADRVIFMDEGKIIEMQKTKDFFEKPQSDRTKLFLSQILR